MWTLQEKGDDRTEGGPRLRETGACGSAKRVPFREEGRERDIKPAGRANIAAGCVVQRLNKIHNRICRSIVVSGKNEALAEGRRGERGIAAETISRSGIWTVTFAMVKSQRRIRRGGAVWPYTGLESRKSLNLCTYAAAVSGGREKTIDAGRRGEQKKIHCIRGPGLEKGPLAILEKREAEGSGHKKSLTTLAREETVGSEV